MFSAEAMRIAEIRSDALLDLMIPLVSAVILQDIVLADVVVYIPVHSPDISVKSICSLLAVYLVT